MKLEADYLDAHKRHWEDAELLMASGRLANADQLFGLSAECGIKALAVILKMKFEKDDWPNRQEYRGHADKIWGRFQTFDEGRLRYPLPEENPFSDWKIDHRYANRNEFKEEHVAAHQSGAKEVQSLIEKAERDGLL